LIHFFTVDRDANAGWAVPLLSRKKCGGNSQSSSGGGLKGV